MAEEEQIVKNVEYKISLDSTSLHQDLQRVQADIDSLMIGAARPVKAAIGFGADVARGGYRLAQDAFSATSSAISYTAGGFHNLATDMGNMLNPVTGAMMHPSSMWEIGGGGYVYTPTTTQAAMHAAGFGLPTAQMSTHELQMAGRDIMSRKIEDAAIATGAGVTEFLGQAAGFTVGGALGAASPIPGGTLIGGLAGSWLWGHTGGKAIDALTEFYADHRNLADTIRSGSESFVSSLRSRDWDRSGFTQAESSSIAWRLQRMAAFNPNFDQTDLEDMLTAGIETGYFGGVEDVGDFENKFKVLVDKVRTVTRALKTSYAEAVKAMQEFKQMGVGSAEDQANLAVLTQSAAGMTNLTTGEAFRMGAMGGETARRYGFSPDVGYRHQLTTASALQYHKEEGILSRRDIAMSGGIENLALEIQRGGYAVMQSPAFEEMLAVAYEGNTTADPAALRRYLSGEMGFDEAQSRIANAYGTPESTFDMRANKDLLMNQLMEDMSPAQFLVQTGAFYARRNLRNFEGSAGYDEMFKNNAFMYSQRFARQMGIEMPMHQLRSAWDLNYGPGMGAVNAQAQREQAMAMLEERKEQSVGGRVSAALSEQYELMGQDWDFWWENPFYNTVTLNIPYNINKPSTAYGANQAATLVGEKYDDWARRQSREFDRIGEAFGFTSEDIEYRRNLRQAKDDYATYGIYVAPDASNLSFSPSEIRRIASKMSDEERRNLYRDSSGANDPGFLETFTNVMSGTPGKYTPVFERNNSGEMRSRILGYSMAGGEISYDSGGPFNVGISDAWHNMWYDAPEDVQRTFKYYDLVMAQEGVGRLEQYRMRRDTGTFMGAQSMVDSGSVKKDEAYEELQAQAKSRIISLYRNYEDSSDRAARMYAEFINNPEGLEGKSESERREVIARRMAAAEDAGKELEMSDETARRFYDPGLQVTDRLRRDSMRRDYRKGLRSEIESAGNFYVSDGKVYQNILRGFDKEMASEADWLEARVELRDQFEKVKADLVASGEYTHDKDVWNTIRRQLPDLEFSGAEVHAAATAMMNTRDLDEYDSILRSEKDKQALTADMMQLYSERGIEDLDAFQTTIEGIIKDVRSGDAVPRDVREQLRATGLGDEQTINKLTDQIVRAGSDDKDVALAAEGIITEVGTAEKRMEAQEQTTMTSDPTTNALITTLREEQKAFQELSTTMIRIRDEIG
jgi:hypothetical protein